MGTTQQVYELMPDNSALGDTKRGQDLSTRLDNLETHITAASIMTKYGQEKTPQNIQRLITQQDEEGRTEVQSKKMLSEFVKMVSQQGEKIPWTSFLEDLLELRTHIYSNLSDDVVRAIHFDHCLSSSESSDTLKLATQLFGDEDGKLPREMAAKIVVTRAQEFFNAANSGDDPYVELAQKCLLLISPPTPAVTAEIDLIAAFDGIAEKYSVHMMPVQFRLRLRENRMSIIEEVLAKSDSAYQDSNRIISLARLLGIVPAAEDDGVETPQAVSRINSVQVLIAQAAFAAKDWPATRTLVTQLADAGYTDIWQLARQLGSEPAFSDTQARRQLLALALQLCPDYELVATLKTWRNVEVRSLCTEDVDDATSEREACSQAVLQAGHGASPEQGTAQLQFTEDTCVLSSTHPFYESTVLPLAFGDVRHGAQVYQLMPPTVSSAARQCQAFIRVYLMSGQDGVDLSAMYTPGKEPDPSVAMAEALTFLARVSAQHHTPLSLAYLLAVVQAELVNDGFASVVPQVEQCLRVWQYYLAVCICMGAKDIQRKSRRLKQVLYLDTMLSAVEHAKRLVADAATIEGVSFMSMFNDSQDQIMKLTEMQRITAISGDVDVQRFIAEEDYRHSTILGLATCSKHFKFVYTLGVRYGVPIHEMHAALAKGLVEQTSANSSTEGLLSDFGVLEGLAGQPIESHHSIMLIFGSIKGSNLGQLHLCYKILAHLEAAASDGGLPTGAHSALNSQNAVLHVDCLRRLRDVDTTGLNYHDLLQCDAPLQLMERYIHRDNVSTMAEILPALRPADISGSLVYSVLCVKSLRRLPCFPNAGVGAKAENLPDSWVQEYRRCKRYFEKLCQYGVWQLYDEAMESDYILELPMAVRLLIVRDLQATAALSKPPTITANVPGSVPLADQLHARLAAAVNQLSILVSESTLSELEKLGRDYIKMYTRARGETEMLNTLVQRMLLDGVALDLVDKFVRLINKVQDPSKASISPVSAEFVDVVVSLMQQYVARYPRHSDEGTTLQRCLRSAKDSVLDLDGQNMGTVAVATVRKFCEDPVHKVEARIALFQELVVAKCIEDPAEENRMSHFYRTQDCVYAAWGGRVVVEAEVADQAARLALFEQLWKECCADDARADAQAVQAAALADTLALWPDADTHGISSYHVYWMHVFRQAIATETVGWGTLASSLAVVNDGKAYMATVVHDSACACTCAKCFGIETKYQPFSVFGFFFFLWYKLASLRCLWLSKRETRVAFPAWMLAVL